MTTPEQTLTIPQAKAVVDRLMQEYRAIGALQAVIASIQSTETDVAALEKRKADLGAEVVALEAKVAHGKLAADTTLDQYRRMTDEKVAKVRAAATEAMARIADERKQLEDGIQALKARSDAELAARKAECALVNEQIEDAGKALARAKAQVAAEEATLARIREAIAAATKV